MSVISFSNTAYANLSFSNISVAETDVGTVDSFTGSTGTYFNAGVVPNFLSPYAGLEWGGFNASALAPGSSTTLTFSYDIASTDPAYGIIALQQAFAIDTIVGTGLTLTALERVYDQQGHLVGQSFIDINTPNHPDFGADPVRMAAAYQSLHVQVTVFASVAANAPAPAQIGFSYIDQGFAKTALAGQATLGDTVFLDANANGIKDAGEAGVAGVTVRLLDQAGADTGLFTATDAAGHYSFANINAGSYRVQFVAGAGQMFTATGQGTAATDSNADPLTGITGVVSLAAGQTDNTIDAGLYLPGTVTAFVYGDADASATLNGAETGLAGVTVTLLNGNGTPTGQTAVTGANGSVAFTGLRPGTYQVAVTQPSGTTQTVPTNLLTPLVVSSGQTVAAVAAFTGGSISHQDAPASLSGHVFTDQNADGVQAAGDANLANVTVQLLDGNGNAIAGATAVTNANGFYSFAGLAPGSYAVRVVAPTNTAFSAPGANPNPALDSIVNAAGRTPTVTLAAGAAAINQNAAVYTPASFVTQVYVDANGDGVRTGGEAAAPGYTVTLTRPDGTTVTAVTDAQGQVSFTGLKPGAYTSIVSNPAGILVSQSTNLGTAITLPSGGSVTAVEGVYVPASFITQVYVDANGDGVRTGGEAAAPGYTVTLTRPDGSTVTAVTDAQGQVSFTGLKPGAYTSTVTNPAGVLVSQSTNLGTAITLPSGGSVTAVEGVYVGACLSGRVFTDQNADGVLLAGDVLRSGVTVQLLDGAGNAITGRIAVTDANGAYSFTGLRPGSYAVKIVPPTGFSFSQVGTNANPALDSIVASTGKTAPVTLASGASVANQNAGLYAPATINARVYADANANASQGSGEAGLSGITVRLLDGSGNPTGTTAVTNASGDVSFTGLLPGSYKLAVVAPGGSTVTQLTNVGNLLTLSSGGVVNAVEGLYQPTGSLSGRVFVDADRSGTINAGDTNLGGQQVQLLDAAGKPIAGRVTLTDASGNYSFAGLAAGSYAVAVTGQSGYAFTSPGTSTTPGINSVVNGAGRSGQVTLGAGQSVTGVNAGEFKVPAAIVVDKSAAVQVVRASGVFNGTSFFAQDTYTYRVTNTGTQALTNVQVLDNHGSAGLPDYVTPLMLKNSSGNNIGDVNNNKLLDVGETWSYSATLVETGYIPVNTSTVAATNFNSVSTKAGSTIWMNASIKNYSTANGTSYAFKGLTATITVPGTASPFVYHLPDSYVSFSSSVTTATTKFDAVQNAWVTVAPAGKPLGDVFMSGLPVTVPAGVDFKNASVVMSMAQATATAGAAAPQWQWSASNYSSFKYCDANGVADYNRIGVKPCDDPCGGGDGRDAGTPCTVLQTCGSAGNLTGGGTCAPPLAAGSLNCWTSQASCGGNAYGNLWSGTRSLGTGTWTMTDAATGLHLGISANDGRGGLVQCASGTTGIGVANGWSCGLQSGQSIAIDCTEIRGKGYQLSSVTLNGMNYSSQTAYVWGSNDGGATKTLIGSCTGGWDTVGTVDGCEGYAKLWVTCSGSGSNLVIGKLGVSCIPNWCGTQSASANVNLSAMTDSAAIDTVTATATTLGTTTTTTVPCSSGWTYGNSGCWYGGDDDRDWRHQSYGSGWDDDNNYWGCGYSNSCSTGSASYNYCGTQTSCTTTTTTPGYAVSAFDTANVEVLTGAGSIYVAGMAAVSDTVSIGSGRDALSLFVTEDYYLAHAQFTVCVDGVQIGGVQTATAARGSGLAQQFKVMGNFSGAAHTVSVNFLNDAYGGTAATDRNLYVAQASFNGIVLANSALTLASSGAQSLSVPALDTLSLSISEDAWMGDAQFTVTLDGAQIGGVQSTAALRSAGASQAFMITGRFASGSHTVSVKFLNDSYGGTTATDRNLFVNNATLNGSTIAGSALSLLGTGAQSFSFQGAGAANGTPATLNAADYAPTGSLSALYGQASKLEFVYTPSDTVSPAVLSAGLGSEAGANTGAMAFMQISSSADAYDAAAQVFYMGNLAPGAKLFADAATNLGNMLNGAPNNIFGGANATIYAHVFANENDYVNHAASAQELVVRPGLGGLQIGDQIGSLKLIGYIGTLGNGYLVA